MDIKIKGSLQKSYLEALAQAKLVLSPYLRYQSYYSEVRQELAPTAQKIGTIKIDNRQRWVNHRYGWRKPSIRSSAKTGVKIIIDEEKGNVSIYSSDQRCD